MRLRCSKQLSGVRAVCGVEVVEDTRYDDGSFCGKRSNHPSRCIGCQGVRRHCLETVASSTWSSVRKPDAIALAVGRSTACPGYSVAKFSVMRSMDVDREYFESE